MNLLAPLVASHAAALVAAAAARAAYRFLHRFYASIAAGFEFLPSTTRGVCS